MPEHKLVVLKPLLSEFAKPTYIIEPASPSECTIAEEHFKEYYENPESFVPLIIETDLTADEKTVINAGRKERKKNPETIKAEVKQRATTATRTRKITNG